MNISGFDAGTYIDNHSNNASALPNIALAFSGGGWRALINGAGVLSAFDSRSQNSTAEGQLGGLLQSATYLAGLSGGNWLVGSIIVNNYTTVEALQNSNIWKFGNSILEGPPSGGIQLLGSVGYYANLLSSVEGKDDAGFDISITDYWARALSYQLINATDGGPSQTWSSIADTEAFRNADHPFPISIADGRAPGQEIISLNSSVFEFNPFEFGTWDPTVYGFLPTRYLGTNMTDGQVASNSQCVVGFDNAAYVMGTSSSLFNSLILDFNSSTATGVSGLALDAAIEVVLKGLNKSDNDIASYRPNPFYGWNPTSRNLGVTSDVLTLVDGGLDNQNVPFHPLIQPFRHVDVIFANDNSADTTTNWPNGSSLVQTYQRTHGTISNGTAFPSIPDVNTFINLGLNTHPTFFGCNVSNITIPSGSTQKGEDVPLIVYLPNYPYVTYSNEPTITFTTNDTYRDAMIANGHDVATMANGTLSGYQNWPQCVACAILSRSFTRTGTTVPQACTQCFKQYCWNGTLAPHTPPTYNPKVGSQALNVASNIGVGTYQMSIHTLMVLVVCTVLALMV